MTQKTNARLDDKPTCPRCRYYHRDFVDTLIDGQEATLTCSSCGTVFEIQCWISLCYRSRLVELHEVEKDIHG